MKLAISQEVARFNQAVEAADRALVWCASEVTDLDRLFALLMWAGCFKEAKELDDAFYALWNKF